MLERLQSISKEKDSESDFYGPESEVDQITLSQQAVVFENSSAIDNILKEVHSIRKDMALLHLEVEHLKKHKERFRTTVQRLTLLKKDSDSIARGIQHHGEALYVRLQALGKESSQLEEKEGPSSAVSRIAQVHYDTLTRAFQTIMSDYIKAEEMQRTLCRKRIQRQASIMGNEITDQQLDVLVEKGGEGWTELSQSLQTQAAHSSRWAINEIKGRHKELVELEARMKEVHELFMHMAMLVEEQGSMLNNIEANVCSSEEYVEEGNVRIKKAVKYKRKNPFRQCCPCLPCWSFNNTI